MKTIGQFAFLLIVSTMIYSCSEDPKRGLEYGEGEGLSVSSLTYNVYQLFSASGYRAEIGPLVEKEYLPKSARGIKINGSPVLFVEFDSQDDFEQFYGSISRDGQMIGPRALGEKKEPHFFASGKVVGIYFGSKEGTLAALSAVMGEQFAGSN